MKLIAWTAISIIAAGAYMALVIKVGEAAERIVNRLFGKRKAARPVFTYPSGTQVPLRGPIVNVPRPKGER